MLFLQYFGTGGRCLVSIWGGTKTFSDMKHGGWDSPEMLWSFLNQAYKCFVRISSLNFQFWYVEFYLSGWLADGRLCKMKLRLTPSSSAKAGTELGNNALNQGKRCLKVPIRGNNQTFCGKPSENLLPQPDLKYSTNPSTICHKSFKKFYICIKSSQPNQS